MRKATPPGGQAFAPTQVCTLIGHVTALSPYSPLDLVDTLLRDTSVFLLLRQPSGRALCLLEGEPGWAISVRGLSS